MKDTAVQRFWAKVCIDGEDDCWEWLASLDDSGYGQLGWTRGKERAHRVSYEIHYGGIPDGMLVLHKCDNRKCVNPKHLFTGTIQDNMSDMIAKGRQARGQSKWTNKLTPEQVVELRERHASGAGEKLSVLALELGISAKQASFIACGDSWKHVGGPLRKKRVFSKWNGVAR